MKRLLFTLLLFIVLAFAYSDVKALSNNCSNAIPLIDSQPVVLEMCNATAAEVQPEGVDFDIRDRWLSFNSGVHNEVLLSLDNLAGVGMTVYSGDSCDDLEFVNSVESFEWESYGNFYFSDLTSGIVPNNTNYFVQFWSEAENQAACGEVTVSAEFHIVGCTDPCLISFNPDATIDNGTCIYQSIPIQWACTPFDISLNNPGPHQFSSPNLSDCWLPEVTDPESEPINPGIYVRYDADGSLVQFNLCSEAESEIHVYEVIDGCNGSLGYVGKAVTTPLACEGYANSTSYELQTEENTGYFFYISSIDDDGSFYYYPYFDVQFSLEDLTVPPDFVADFNSDGETNSTDLLIFIAFFGCTGEDCLGDLNNDGIVNTSDLILLLTDFSE